MSLQQLLSLCSLPLLAEAAKLLASHYSGSLYTLDLSDNGELSIASETSSGSRMPAWITLDSGGKTAYIPDESWFGSGTLTSFSMGEDAAIASSGQVQTKGGELHSCLYGGEDGEGFIALANYEGPYILNYKLPLASGAQPLQTITFTMDGTGPFPDRQNKPHPHSVVGDPTGEYIVVPDLGADLVRISGVDASTGQLTECPSAEAAPGDGPRHGEFAKLDDATVLYTVNELGNSVTAWAVDYPQGACLSLKPLQTLSTFPDDATPPPGSKAAEVHVKPPSVYVTNRFDRSFGAEADSVSSLSVSPSGQLTRQDFASAHAYFPRTFAINRIGDLIAVGGQTSANVAILERNTTSGEIGELVASVDVGAKGTENQEDGLSAVVWVE